MTKAFIVARAAVTVYGQETRVAFGSARGVPEFVNGGRWFTPEETLKGVTARLPRIADLGAAMVCPSPIQRMSAAGGFTNPRRISDQDSIGSEGRGRGPLRPGGRVPAGLLGTGARGAGRGEPRSLPAGRVREQCEKGRARWICRWRSRSIWGRLSTSWESGFHCWGWGASRAVYTGFTGW